MRNQSGTRPVSVGYGGIHLKEKRDRRYDDDDKSRVGRADFCAAETARHAVHTVRRWIRIDGRGRQNYRAFVGFRRNPVIVVGYLKTTLKNALSTRLSIIIVLHICVHIGSVLRVRRFRKYVIVFGNV